MRQKTVLAGALLHEPKLLILDEPLTGLDASAARDVKDLLAARVAQGASIVLTTHILEVAERLASRIGIITAGRLLAIGTMDELRRPRRLRLRCHSGGCLPPPHRTTPPPACRPLT